MYACVAKCFQYLTHGFITSIVFKYVNTVIMINIYYFNIIPFQCLMLLRPFSNRVNIPPPQAQNQWRASPLFQQMIVLVPRPRAKHRRPTTRPARSSKCYTMHATHTVYALCTIHTLDTLHHCKQCRRCMECIHYFTFRDSTLRC